jgi:hypothetical protein
VSQWRVSGAQSNEQSSDGLLAQHGRAYAMRCDASHDVAGCFRCHGHRALQSLISKPQWLTQSRDDLQRVAEHLASPQMSDGITEGMNCKGRYGGASSGDPQGDVSEDLLSAMQPALSTTRPFAITRGRRLAIARDPIDRHGHRHRHCH